MASPAASAPPHPGNPTDPATATLAAQITAVDALTADLAARPNLPPDLRRDLIERTAHARRRLEALRANRERAARPLATPPATPAAPTTPAPPPAPLLPDWIRRLAPAAAENLMYLLGGFLVVAGAIYFASTAWTTMSGPSRLLLLTGGLTALGALLIGLGHLLTRGFATDPAGVRVRRITAHLAAGLTPLAAIIAGRLLVAAPLTGAATLAAVLAAGAAAHRLATPTSPRAATLATLAVTLAAALAPLLAAPFALALAAAALVAVATRALPRPTPGAAIAQHAAAVAALVIHAGLVGHSVATGALALAALAHALTRFVPRAPAASPTAAASPAATTAVAADLRAEASAAAPVATAGPGAAVAEATAGPAASEATPIAIADPGAAAPEATPIAIAGPRAAASEATPIAIAGPRAAAPEATPIAIAGPRAAAPEAAAAAADPRAAAAPLAAPRTTPQRPDPARPFALATLALALVAVAPAFADPRLLPLAAALAALTAARVALRLDAPPLLPIPLLLSLVAYITAPAPVAALTAALRDAFAAAVGHPDTPLPLAWYGLTCLPYLAALTVAARALARRPAHARVVTAWLMLVALGLCALAIASLDPRPAAAVLTAEALTLLIAGALVPRRGPLVLGALTLTAAALAAALWQHWTPGAALLLAAAAHTLAAAALRRLTRGPRFTAYAWTAAAPLVALGLALQATAVEHPPHLTTLAAFLPLALACALRARHAAEPLYTALAALLTMAAVAEAIRLLALPLDRAAPVIVAIALTAQELHRRLARGPRRATAPAASTEARAPRRAANPAAAIETHASVGDPSATAHHATGPTAATELHTSPGDPNTTAHRATDPATQHRAPDRNPSATAHRATDPAAAPEHAAATDDSSANPYRATPPATATEPRASTGDPNVTAHRVTNPAAATESGSSAGNPSATAHRATECAEPQASAGDPSATAPTHPRTTPPRRRPRILTPLALTAAAALAIACISPALPGYTPSALLALTALLLAALWTHAALRLHVPAAAAIATLALAAAAALTADALAPAPLIPLAPALIALAAMALARRRTPQIRRLRLPLTLAAAVVALTAAFATLALVWPAVDPRLPLAPLTAFAALALAPRTPLTPWIHRAALLLLPLTAALTAGLAREPLTVLALLTLAPLALTAIDLTRRAGHPLLAGTPHGPSALTLITLALLMLATQICWDVHILTAPITLALHATYALLALTHRARRPITATLTLIALALLAACGPLARELLHLDWPWQPVIALALTTLAPYAPALHRRTAALIALLAALPAALAVTAWTLPRLLDLAPLINLLPPAPELALTLTLAAALITRATPEHRPTAALLAAIPLAALHPLITARFTTDPTPPPAIEVALLTLLAALLRPRQATNAGTHATHGTDESTAPGHRATNGTDERTARGIHAPNGTDDRAAHAPHATHGTDDRSTHGIHTTPGTDQRTTPGPHATPHTIPPALTITLALLALIATGGEYRSPILPLTLTLLAVAPLLRALRHPLSPPTHRARHLEATLYALCLAATAWLIHLVPSTGSHPAEILPPIAAVVTLTALLARLALPLLHRHDPTLTPELTPRLPRIRRALAATALLTITLNLALRAPAPASTPVLATALLALALLFTTAAHHARRHDDPTAADLALLTALLAHAFLAHRHPIPPLEGHHLLLWAALAPALRILPTTTAIAVRLRRRALLLPLPALILHLPDNTPHAIAALLAAATWGLAARQTGRPTPTWIGLALLQLAATRIWLANDIIDPTFYGLPAGLILLIGARIERDHLTPRQTEILQLTGITTAYITILAQLIRLDNPAHALLLLTLGLATVALGWIRHRGDLLIAGALATITTVALHLIRTGFARGFLAAALLITAGALILTLAARHTRRRAK